VERLHPDLEVFEKIAAVVRHVPIQPVKSPGQRSWHSSSAQGK
jgi:hypothetical protein